jgi:hypothetical protein
MPRGERYEYTSYMANGESAYNCGACVKQLWQLWMNILLFVLSDLHRHPRSVRRICSLVENFLN